MNSFYNTYDIYYGNLTSLKPPKKLESYEAILTENYDLKFRILDNELLFNKTLCTMYKNTIYFVKRHNFLVLNNQTTEEAQDLIFIK